MYIFTYISLFIDLFISDNEGESVDVFRPPSGTAPLRRAGPRRAVAAAPAARSAGPAEVGVP